MSRRHSFVTSASLVFLAGMLTTAAAATLTLHPSEADFLAALGPQVAVKSESFDGFAEGTVIASLPGVDFSSPNSGTPGFVPIQASAAPQAVSSPNILVGGSVDGNPIQQIIVMDFPESLSALAFQLVGQNPERRDVVVTLEFTSGLPQALTIADNDGNNSPVEFFGVTSDTPIVRATIESGEESSGLFQNFGGIDDLKLGMEDTNSPICSAAPDETAGGQRIDGTATETRVNDTGIVSVTLEAGFTNLVLDVNFFMPPATAVSFSVEPDDPEMDAEGTVIVTDGAGNTCRIPVDFRLLPGGPADNVLLCDGDGIFFSASNDDDLQAGTAACSSNPFTQTEVFPPGYELFPTDCNILTLVTPISGPTDPELEKGGVFDSRLRLLFTRSDDGGTTFPDYTDITTSVEPILTIPDPTRLKGKTVQWSVVKFACAVLAEICDGIDNDGDGVIDEGLPPVGDLTIDDDGDGVPLCAIPPDCSDQLDFVFPGAPELCNGIDDNCNGTLDEDNPGGNELCLLSGPLGACAEGTTECALGALSCIQVLFPGDQAESCDSVDNDCDGATDEGLGQTTCGFGVCDHTVDNCVDGVEQDCDPFEGASTEACDSLDNDCDGATDEDLGQTTCGLGVCTNTVANCVSGVTQQCDPFLRASNESCDGLDNDCDGAVDDGLGSTTCGIGACQNTVANCLGGEVQPCEPLLGDAVDTCNDGIDNDCDGEIDEDYVFGGYEQPVNADGSSIFQWKRVIPFKFELTDCDGLSVTTAVATIEVIFLQDGVVGTEMEEVHGAGRANKDDLYRLSGTKYIYNLSTKNLRGDASYVVRTHLDDGSFHDVTISLVP